MIIEKRGLIQIGKNYCLLIDYLDKENILYYETDFYDEIIIDLDEFEFDSFTKEELLLKLCLSGFISYSQKQSIIENSLNKLVFWR